MSDAPPPPPPQEVTQPGGEDPNDPTTTASLYQFLQSKWLGSSLALFTDKLQYQSLLQLKQAITTANTSENDATKAKIIGLFQQTGQRLKMRVLLDQLQLVPKSTPSKSVISMSSTSSTVTAAVETEADVTDDEGANEKDESDDEADVTVSVEKRLAEPTEEPAPTPKVEPTPAPTPTPTTTTSTPTVAAERPLWKEVLDKSSGKPYWYNRTTKETTWDDPYANTKKEEANKKAEEDAAAAAKKQQADEAAAAEAKKKSEVAQAIEEAAIAKANLDAAAKAVIEANRRSSAAAPFVTPTPTTTTPERPLWKEVMDKASGKPYWYNRITKETTWVNPLPNTEALTTPATPAVVNPVETKPTPVATTTPAATVDGTAAPRPLWKEVLDKSSGKPYWYNRITKETTWINPSTESELAAAAEAQRLAEEKQRLEREAALKKQQEAEEAIELEQKKRREEEEVAAAKAKAEEEEAAAAAAATEAARLKAAEDAKAAEEAEAARVAAAAELAQKQAEEAQRLADEFAAKAKEAAAAAAAAKKKAEEEAAAVAMAKKKTEEEALAKKRQEEEEAAQKRRAAEEAAAAAAAAAKKKQEEEEAAAKKKREEEEAIAAAALAAKKKADEETAAAAAALELKNKQEAEAAAAAAKATTEATRKSSTVPPAPTERPLWKEVLDKSSGKPYWYNRITKETTWVNPMAETPATTTPTPTVPSTATTVSAPVDTTTPATKSTPVVEPKSEVVDVPASSPTPSRASTAPIVAPVIPNRVSVAQSTERPLWKEVLDKATGKPYWYNRVTKETTWINPLPAAVTTLATEPTPVTEVKEVVPASIEPTPPLITDAHDEETVERTTSISAVVPASTRTSTASAPPMAPAMPPTSSTTNTTTTAPPATVEPTPIVPPTANTSSTTPAERPIWREVKDSATGKPYWYNRQTRETTWSNPFAELADTVPELPPTPTSTTNATSSAPSHRPTRSRASISSLPLLSNDSPIPQLPPAESESDSDEEEEGEEDDKVDESTTSATSLVTTAPTPTPAPVITKKRESVMKSTPTNILTKPSDLTNAPLTLKQRLAQLQAGGFNPTGAPAPPPTTSAPKPALSGLTLGLKERMAALAAQPGAPVVAIDEPESRIRASSFQRKQANLAMTIGTQFMMGSLPASGLMAKSYGAGEDRSYAYTNHANPQQTSSTHVPTSTLSSSVQSAPLGGDDEEADPEYDLPPISSIAEPQKTGFLEKLEKTGFISHKTEYVSRFCLLKDDGLFWLLSKKDKYPKGVICLSDPGLTFTNITPTELEVVTKTGKKHQFKSSTPEELNGWLSKMKMAKLLYGQGGAQNGSSFLKNLRKQPKSNGSVPPPPEPEEEEPPPPNNEPLTVKQLDYIQGPQPIITLPAFGSGIVPTSAPSTTASSTSTSHPDEKLWSDMLVRGGIFSKYKYGKGQKRLIWCPSSLDRLLWGDEKKKKVKGYVMICDVTAVRDGCEGSKKSELALTIVTPTRLLELESLDSQQKQVWKEALNWLIGAGQ